MTQSERSQCYRDRIFNLKNGEQLDVTKIHKIEDNFIEMVDGCRIRMKEIDADDLHRAICAVIKYYTMLGRDLLNANGNNNARRG